MKRSGIIYIYREELFIDETSLYLKRDELLIRDVGVFDKRHLQSIDDIQFENKPNFQVGTNKPRADSSLAENISTKDEKSVEKGLNDTSDYQSQQYQKDDISLSTKKSREFVIDHSLFDLPRRNESEPRHSETESHRSTKTDIQRANQHINRDSFETNRGRDTSDDRRGHENRSELVNDSLRSESNMFLKKQKLREMRVRNGRSKTSKKSVKIDKKKIKSKIVLKGSSSRSPKNSNIKKRNKKGQDQVNESRSLGRNLIVDLLSWFFGMDVLARLIIAAVAGIVIFGFLFAQLGIFPGL